MTRSGAEARLDVRPLSTRIGAEIRGIDLSRPLPDSELEQLRAAIDRWRVVFARGQFLDHAAHVALGRQLGPLVYPNSYDPAVPPPATASDDVHAAWQQYPEVYRVDHRQTQARAAKAAASSTPEAHPRGNSFRGVHVDSGAAVNPPSISILRSDVVPPYGGDTTWFDLVSAYEGLSEPIRRFVDPLWVEHRFGLEFAPYLEGRGAKYRVTHHPLVRVLPTTAEHALLVNPVLPTRVLDVSPSESEWILTFLHAQVIRPAYAIRFRWEPGDVAISDNRATAHLGPQDLADDVDRVLHLVEVDGEIPFSPDGRRSVSIEGEPKLPSPRELAASVRA